VLTIIYKNLDQENLDQENLNSSLCIHDARNFDEYTQVFAGDTTNKWHFWEERRVLAFVLHYYVQLYCEGD
jgi:hypothetical protein